MCHCIALLQVIVLQLGRAHEQIIQPLERFRKEHIGAVKVRTPVNTYYNITIQSIVGRQVQLTPRLNLAEYYS